MKKILLIIIASISISLIILYIFYINYQIKSNVNKDINVGNEEIEIKSFGDFVFSFFQQNPYEEVISLKFTGDIILARSVNFLTVKNNDFTWSFKNIADELKDADITISNLESPLIKNCPLTNEGFKFCGDERNSQGVKFAGIDVIGLANNHAGNYGEDGVNQTISNLEKEGILVSGTTQKQIAYKEVKGTKFAFLALNSIGYKETSLVWLEEATLKDLILEAKNNADVVIVQLHWGEEYTDTPNDFQKKYGHLAIDLGADMVVGNHPHWVQNYEVYKDKYILYALGNFIFDQEWSAKTKQGVIAKVDVKNKKIGNLKFIPVEIKNYGQVFKSLDSSIIPSKME